MAPLSGSETVATLNGLFKEVYPQGIKMLVPEGLKVQNMISFVPKELETGNKYHQPVQLAYPGGFTHAGPGAGAFALNGAVASTMKDTEVQGSQILLQEYMDYEAAARAAKGRNAFKDATALMFELMQKSIRKRLECELLYGSAGLGVVSAKSGSTSPVTITFAAAQWAPGIWSGSEGHKFDFYSTGGVQRNTNAPLVISSVDIDARQIIFTGNNTDIAAIQVGDLIYFDGAFGNEMAGIHRILTNTSSLFGIDASVYNLWRSTSYSAGNAAATFNKVKAMIGRAVGRGLDEDCAIMVNPKTWDDLMGDLAALRRFVEKQGRGTSYEIGSENIIFYSQNGKIEIMPSIYIWEGFAYELVKSNWKRIGAADISFNTPSMGDQMFLHRQDYAAFEVRCYTNQAIFCEMPARQSVMTGIVNTET